MKKIILIYITIILLIITTINIPIAKSTQSTLQLHTINKQIKYHYHFDTPISKQDIIKPIRLLLPPSTTIKNITIASSNTEPIPFIITTTSLVKTRSFSRCANTETLPQTLYTTPDIQYFRGYPILNINIHPIQYNATTNSYYLHKDIFINITLKQTSTYHPLYRNGLDQEDLLNKIDNPEELINYPTSTQSHFFDYVIITTNDLKDTPSPNLNDLIRQRESQRLSCMIKTVEDIKTDYAGIDTPEKIRNFIKDAYTTYGITYILLAGNINKVPIRYLYDIDGDEPTREIPSDIYYQCLDGNYNYDNDSHWGEKFDGVGGSQIDLYAEIYIGRAPVNNASDISSFVEKTLTYENTIYQFDSYTKNCLSIGEKLWDGMGGLGSKYVEKCIDKCTDYNQITNGIPSNTFTIIKLYDSKDYTCTKTDIIEKINNGVGIINHVGHGLTNKAMLLSLHDITELTNTNKYCFLYSQACNSGKLDPYNECFAERWINAEKAGGFAAIMNTGKGYGSEFDYDGPDNRYAREFFDALFHENISRLGKANQDSKEDNIWHIHESEKNMYHVYYATELFGDPYTEIKGTKEIHKKHPYTPEKPSGPLFGTANTSYTFITSTIDPDNNIIKYIWDFGDGNTVLTNWYSSGEQCTISHTWKYNTTYNIRVKAKNSEMLESNWSPTFTIVIGDTDKPHITIATPENALYIQNTKIHSYIFRNPLIFGKINITVNATDSTSYINNVTFYIDNIMVKKDTTYPYTYTWNKKTFGIYTIKVIAYDIANNYNIKEITTWKFF